MNANSFEVRSVPGVWKCSSAKAPLIFLLLSQLTEATCALFFSIRLHSALRTTLSMKRRAFPIRSLRADARLMNPDSNRSELLDICAILALCCCFSNSSIPSFSSLTACKVACHLSVGRTTIAYLYAQRTLDYCCVYRHSTFFAKIRAPVRFQGNASTYKKVVLSS